MKVVFSTTIKINKETFKVSKKFKKEVKNLVSKKLPNSIGAVDEMYGVVKSGRIKFYTEDNIQMAKMDIKERLDYKERLIESGRYYSQ